MRGREPRLSWVLLVLWSSWLYALASFFAANSGAGAWTPDAGLVLVLALGTELRGRRFFLAALLVAATRIAFTLDPPVAVLAGYLGIAGVQAGLRTFVNLDEPLSRGLLASAGVLVLGLWWPLVHAARVPGSFASSGPLAGSDFGGGLAWRAALTTAVVAVFAWDLLPRLPGLRPLWRAR